MILVTGAARSGTSVITKMLQEAGAYLGKPQDVNDLYENIYIREKVLKPMMVHYGGDRRGQRVFPDLSRVRNEDNDDGIHHAMNRVFYGKDNPAYKDAKLILLWERWARVYPEAKWLIVRRSIDGIADSCMRTHFMNTYNTKNEWIEWAKYHEKRIDSIISNPNTNTIEVWPEEVLQDVSKMKHILDHLGLEYDADSLNRCIDKDKFVRYVL